MSLVPAARLPTVPAPAAAAEPALSEQDFARIAALLKAQAGIALPHSKRSLVHSRLARRLRALQLPGFGAYLQLVEGADGAAERGEMISALTTNVTSFFRERHHFELLRDRVLPPLIARARQGGRVRLWSAGCSTGEEPYSMAMVLLGLDPEAATLDIRILATDIDPAVLARARAGRYDADSAGSLPAEPRLRWFEEDGGGGVRVRPALQRPVVFGELNLAAGWPVRGPFDVIFCRNVTIYFDRQGQERIWAGFARLLPPGGVLCIGHSERVTGPATAQFRSGGITAYTRAG